MQQILWQISAQSHGFGEDVILLRSPEPDDVIEQRDVLFRVQLAPPTNKSVTRRNMSTRFSETPLWNASSSSAIIAPNPLIAEHLEWYPKGNELSQISSRIISHSGNTQIYDYIAGVGDIS
jgi:hypothetical protein